MAMLYYWGEGGQFGPYAEQKDGWPNAGEVMRDFRERMRQTPDEFARHYSEGLKNFGKQNRGGKQGRISGTWILNMEKQNRVPADIERRRLIAHILKIPPILLGLASFEAISIQPQNNMDTIAAHKRIHMLQKVSTDLTTYHNTIHLGLQLHKTSHAQKIMNTLIVCISDLRSLESQTKGDLLYRVRELLLAYYLLATKIVKDSRDYAHAYILVNDAVRVAKNIGDSELIAAARYARGCTNLEWGSFGHIEGGIFHPKQEKIHDAIRDLQTVLKQSEDEPESVHPQLRGFTMLQLSRGQSLSINIKQGLAVSQALKLTDLAIDCAGQDKLDDIYTRLLVTGTISGLHLGAYHLIKAEILTILGLAGQAYLELKQVKKLTEKTYGRDETRNQAWIDVAESKMCIGLEKYEEAASKARDALLACQDIYSMQNIAVIADIHGQLATSAYGKSIDVRELGDMLNDFTRAQNRRQAAEKANSNE